MRTLFGAVTGALALGAVLVAYNLGENRTFSRDYAMNPTAFQQPVASPYLVQAGQTGYVSPYAPYAANGFASPYASGGVVTPAAAYPAQPVYVAQRPVVQRATATQRTYATERSVKPQRTWQKSAILIGGSAAGGAGIGALIGGKKGAGIGALLGGGTAALIDYSKRH